jgi:hypothetical protein
MRRKLVVAVAACAVAVPAPAAAAPKTVCGSAVLKDWADGKIDRAYPIRCYQDALNRMPEDMRSYTTAPDDVRRAMLARLRAARLHHPRAQAEAKRVRQPAQAQATRPAQSPTSRLAREALAAGNFAAPEAGGIPRPLVILAGVALILLIAASGGVVTRKLRS